MSAHVTFWMQLDQLDAESATFVAGDTGCQLRLPREDWERQGRPGNVEITPKPTER